MSALNLNSPMGIFYIVLVIVGCLVGIFILKRFWDNSKPRVERLNSDADFLEGRKSGSSRGGKRRKHKRPRK